MNRTEFLEILREQLSGEMPEGSVAAHIRYYHDNSVYERQHSPPASHRTAALLRFPEIQFCSYCPLRLINAIWVCVYSNIIYGDINGGNYKIFINHNEQRYIKQSMKKTMKRSVI